MHITGKIGYFEYNHIKWRFLNQRNEGWNHSYEYSHRPGGTLASSGCGIFAMCFAIQKMCGREICAEALAEFSMSNGGRVDDGTDRPALLKALKQKGDLSKYGIAYYDDDHLNDHELLWQTLKEGGCALCNLRVGHIVALVGYREKDGERQVLVMDSHSESGNACISGHVREVIDRSLVISPVKNVIGLVTSYQVNYGMFWVPLSLAMDFDLLHPLK